MTALYLMAAGDAMFELIESLFEIACGAAFGVMVVLLTGMP